MRCDGSETFGTLKRTSAPMVTVAPAPRVLVVDDEELVRTFAGRVLRDGGYEVVEASDGDEVLQLVEQQRPFDLFVIDLVMPGMSGDELARQLRRREPDTKVLYFTGYSDRLFQEKSELWENEAFLEKPVTIKGLREAVSLLLFGHNQGPRTPPPPSTSR
jgi:two-component system cell cycle sensor histidine kinase/response regulator CckA